MARKSRQNQQLQAHGDYKQVHPETIPTLNHTALYVRLSLYDMNNICHDSIQNQISLVENYIENHPDLHLEERYIDNGWTGMDFQRPAFLRMMQDILDGKINCVVTKDLSRLGRDYLETGYYLENLFPMLGVRYISINDEFDSKTSDSGQLSIILKNILNDFFSRDQSRRHSASHDLRREQGVFRNGLPYGYIYDPERPNHLTFDPETAPIVKLIFSWALDGASTHAITTWLTEMDVPTPSMIKSNRSDGRWRASVSEHWVVRVVNGILRNRTYAGDFVCGKSYHRKYDLFHKQGKLPEEEWIIVPNAHPAYITHEEFDRLQERAKDNKRNYDQAVRENAAIYAEQPNFYKGLLYCAVCGHSICLNGAARNESKSALFLVYTCQNFGLAAPSPHPRLSIWKNLLDIIVLAQLRNQFRLAAQFREWLLSSDGKSKTAEYISMLQIALNTAHSKLQNLRTDRKNIFESHVDAQIDDKMLMQKLKHLRSTERSASLDTEQAASTLMYARKALSVQNPWIVLFTSVDTPEQLSAALTHQFIHRIDLNYSEQVTIQFKEQRWFELLRCIYEGLEAEQNEHG